MKYIKSSLSIVTAAIMMVSCETQKVETIDLTNLEQGGYVRVVPFEAYRNSGIIAKAQADFVLANFSASKFETVLEAVTPNKGALFATYELSVRFVDNTPANGNNSVAAVPLKTLSASSFVKDPVTGYPRFNLSITGAEMITATKVALTSLTAQPLIKLANGNLSPKIGDLFREIPGDRFEVSAVMTLTDGRKYSASNTGVNITGGAFYSSPFLFPIRVVTLE